MIFNSKPIQQVSPQSQYSDLALGLRSFPPHTFEFHVGGIDDGTGFLQIFDLLRVHKAKLVSHFGYMTGKPATGFTLSFVIDVSSMDCQPDDLLIFLRKMKFVRWAEKAKMSGKTFSNFHFKVMLGDRRSVIVDAESLSALILPFKSKNQQSEVAAAVREAGRNFGLLLSKSIPGSVKGQLSSQPESVIDWIKGYLQTSGWGLFSYSIEDGVYTIRLAEPPVSENWDGPVSSQTYLCGLILGLIEGVTKPKKLEILNVYYNKENRALTLFVAEEKPVEQDQQSIEQMQEPVALPREPEEPIDRGTIPSSSFPVKQVEAKQTTDISSADTKQMTVIRKILTLSKKGTQKVRIMHSARISFSEATKLINELASARLLEAKELESGATTYTTTRKGLDLLEEQTIASTTN